MDTSFILDSKESPGNDSKQYTLSELYTMQHELRFSIGILSTHCLSFAARWASELLISINKQISNKNTAISEMKHDSKTPPKYSAYLSNMSLLSDECMLAKTYFDLKDYYRVIQALKNEDLHQNNYAFFLHSYAQYLVGEKRKEESILESNNQLEKSQVINANLSELIDAIHKREKQFEARKNNSKMSLDGFHYYMKGVCLRELNRDTEAIEALIQSVNTFPYNWSAWRSLSELIINEKVFLAVKAQLTNHWICSIFIAEVMVETTEFYHSLDILKYFNHLCDKLPQNTYILGQTALMLYNLHKFDECIAIFSEILSIDPFRIELLDVYSNILYVKEKRKELSYLAHRCMEMNKYRAETCCVVGNYYGMYGMHEKAILYFERSLALNANFISSYVLMGHEYIELRNETAAIECYRKSIELNVRDYRGWYGLGQTYELLQMYNYSIFYYNKVCKLRPYDYRMWMALAHCYRNLGNIPMSISAFERAEQIAMTNGGNMCIDIEYKNIIFELAKLYEMTSQMNKAQRKYHKYVSAIVESESQNRLLNDNETEAFIKLSEMALNRSEFGDAVKYAQRIIKCGQKGKETANRILKQIRSHQMSLKMKGGNMKMSKNKNGNNKNKNVKIVNENKSDNEEDNDEDDMEISYIN